MSAAPTFVRRMTGKILRSEEPGVALVVNCPTEPVDALIELLDAEVGWANWSADNPVLIKASSQVRMEVWRSCTKAWREAEYVSDDYGSSWWAPNGDGRRLILVASYAGDIYDLGRAACDAAS